MFFDLLIKFYFLLPDYTLICLFSNYFSQSLKCVLNLYIIFHYGFFENFFLISMWNIFVRNFHTIFCNKLIHWSTVSLNNILGVLRSAGKCWEEGGEAYENFLVKNRFSPPNSTKRVFHDHLHLPYLTVIQIAQISLFSIYHNHISYCSFSWFDFSSFIFPCYSYFS